MAETFLDYMSRDPVKTEIESNFMKYSVPGKNCKRKCIEGDMKVCYFKFNLELYQTLGGYVFILKKIIQ